VITRSSTDPLQRALRRQPLVDGHELRHRVGVTTSEARRHELYHRLEEVLGTDRADTLMSCLPTVASDQLATKDDLEALRTELEAIRRDLGTGLQAVNERLDRLFVTLAAGLLAVVGAMIAGLFVG
jgi:hypothetical protein